MVKKWSVEYPALNGPEQRNAYLYLPPMYDEDPGRRFPVLYMFDGQNVFWDKDATYGKSWGMEEFLDQNRVPVIVAALECNTGAHNERLAEYSPYPVNDKFFGKFTGVGEDTIQWFITQFKPFVDEHCRTLPDREHTFIAGSSMGGLMSLYALFHHNDVFGRAAALSPSIWVSVPRLSREMTQNPIAPDTVLYMDYGSEEMGNHEGMCKGFANFGAKVMQNGIHLTNRIIPGGTHSEASWERQLPFVFETLFYGLDL